MVTRRKPKPKPHQSWLTVVVGGMAAGMGTIGSIATPDNVQWLMSHGGRLFTLIATALAVVNCVKAFLPDKTKK